MIRPVLIAALLAAAPLGAAMAEPQTSVAGAFIAAAQTQDRKAVIDLLADDVNIDYPTGANLGQQGHGEGQAFVIGYLDGLFGAERGLSVDSAAEDGDAVRFLAHDRRTPERYAIDVQVQNHQVVRVTVNLQDRAAVAALGPR